MPIYPSGTLIANRYEVVQGPREKPSLAGGMGLVYICVDRAENGRPVALKTFRPELLPDRAARDRFLREGTTWVQLGKHPHIVRCYQVFKADVGPEVFFVLELVAAAEGKRDASLRSWLIPGKPLPVEQALLFALHIARGMKHATTKIPGLVHRDLKPENVLVGRDGVARITDFGLVLAMQEVSSKKQIAVGNESEKVNLQRTVLTQGVAGTPRYMAPEQWQGGILDARTDIYAFGCILYEMLTGDYAVQGRSYEEMQSWQLRGGWLERLSEVPASVRGVLQGCLCGSRDDRIGVWDEVATLVAAAYEQENGRPTPGLVQAGDDSAAERVATGWSYNAMGLSYQDIGKFSVARDYFEKVLAIGRQEGERSLQAAALGNLGNAYGQLGDGRRAIEYFEQHLVIARETGDRYGEGWTLGNLGNAYRHLGDARRAIEFYEQSLAIAQEIGDRRVEGNALGNLGEAYRQLGDARQAIEFCEQHLDIAREIGDRHGEGGALGGLGIAYGQLGDAHRAIGYYEQWLTISREIGDRHGEGQALGNLGIAYHQLGDAHGAIGYYEQTLAISREIGDRHSEGQALGNLGSAYHQLGDARQAIEYYERSLVIMREIDDIMNEALFSLNLAILYSQQGNFRETRPHAQYALQVFSQAGHVQYAAEARQLLQQIE